MVMMNSHKYDDTEDNNDAERTVVPLFLIIITSTTDSGQTPLHLAASEGLLACTEILVQAGADVLAQDGMGNTPLDLARIWCHRKVAR